MERQLGQCLHCFPLLAFLISLEYDKSLHVKAFWNWVKQLYHREIFGR